MADKVIGIDLGTTNSVVAVMEGGDPVVIPNAEGGRTTPSVVGFTKDGERLVGRSPSVRPSPTPEHRLLDQALHGAQDERGREESEARAVQGRRRRRTTSPRSRSRGSATPPPEVSAMILQKMKQTAEDYLGQTVTKAVITVPAYFNDSQRQATKDAGKIAGLDVLRIINEPTAAALAYGLDKKKDEKVAVFDLGGGTYDISVLELYDVDGSRQFEVKSTNGDTHLGGDDFDQRVIDWIVGEFKRDQGDRPLEGPDGAPAPQGSGGEGEDGAVEHQLDGHQPALHHRRPERPEAPELHSSRAPSSSSSWTTSSRARSSPCARRSRTRGSSRRTSTRCCSSAARTRIPKIQEEVKKFFGKEPNKGVNPDEVVAIGAAVQGAVLTGEQKDVLLLDVTPLSLGIETLGGVTTVLIPRNTTIPTKKSETFSTADDNQTTVEIHVLQGERELARDNRTIGKFQLTGIPPAPRGMPQVEVTFDIDANGILHVAAKDKATNKEQKIRVEASSGLSDADIDKMVKDAEKNADEDKKRREEIDTRNRLDSMTYEVEKNSKEWADKLPAELKTRLDASVERARKALRGDDMDEIRAAQEELSKTFGEAGQSFYAQSQAAEDAGGRRSPRAGNAGGEARG